MVAAGGRGGPAFTPAATDKFAVMQPASSEVKFNVNKDRT
jgi:hypothetical protein